MPFIPAPDKRLLVDRRAALINDVGGCEIYVYEEMYSALFGFLKWKGRRVKVVVPAKCGAFETEVTFCSYRRVGFYERFSATDRLVLRERPDVKDHVEEVVNRASDWIDERPDKKQNFVIICEK